MQAVAVRSSHCKDKCTVRESKGTHLYSMHILWCRTGGGWLHVRFSSGCRV